VKAIINAKIVVEQEILTDRVLLFDKKIISIVDEVAEDVEIIDAQGAYLSAGFIDIHIHGTDGFDVMDSTFESLNGISQASLRTGTTSILATTMTMSPQDIKNALANVRRGMSRVDGAKILGVHLEGPFINPSKVGAQNSKYIQTPSLELIEGYMDIIRVITLAPELEGAEEFIRYVRRNYPNTILSLGHTGASYHEAKRSFEWGVSHATHIFNAMNPLHHREVGAVGAVLADSSISCELIADNIHIHPALYGIVYRLKGEKLILITDSIRARCLKRGIYSLGGQEVVFVQDGEARLKNGALAGSVLKLNEALKNVYQNSNIPLPELLALVTSSPAQKLGLKLGKLQSGYSADMVLFDENFNIIQTFRDGEMSLN